MALTLAEIIANFLADINGQMSIGERMARLHSARFTPPAPIVVNSAAWTGRCCGKPVWRDDDVDGRMRGCDGCPQ